MPHVYKCIVNACENSSYWLDKHNKIKCLKHDQPYKQCPCLPSFRLLSIPDSNKKPEEYSRYCTLVNRCDKANPLTLLQPAKSSNVYVGRISDGELVKTCGWLDHLEPNDVVMADRGFSCMREDLALHLCELYVPEGKRGVRQFTEEQVNQTKSVANTRIYVEQAIERMKKFRFLKFEVPLSASVTITHAVKIAATITNLGKPLCT